MQHEAVVPDFLQAFIFNLQQVQLVLFFYLPVLITNYLHNLQPLIPDMDKISHACISFFLSAIWLPQAIWLLQLWATDV